MEVFDGESIILIEKNTFEVYSNLEFKVIVSKNFI